MNYLTIFGLLIISLSSSAEEKPYTMDSYLPPINVYEFYREDKIRPQKSDFKIKSTIAMSNEDGNRAVLVSIENLSSGRRILEPEQIVVMYANGDVTKLSSLPKKITVDGGASVNMTIELGYNIYPIISVLTSNNLKQ
ncbi:MULTISPECIES: hypothetical protein [Pseudoalteromonas]|uniref:Uncharacterized protein n=1 Tax=Pseudoalteromonas obscura TaxID=3048491 RepID=A0ABT7ENQ9_9GAMM|nr:MULTISPECIES: hypothetical protein [Pseudoalteromonas]MBQ4835286.1 hypothetical protein [Pseudoalteromonas luteoviolacea]MDK2596684.1 hypothetical protein [Pseudoalteromonas sp. P94(2023)]